MALILKYQTKTQFITRLREKYLKSNKEQCAKLSTWIMNKIDDGDFSDTEIKDSFGMSVVEWVSFKNELNTLRSSYNIIQNARGK